MNSPPPESIHVAYSAEENSLSMALPFAPVAFAIMGVCVLASMLLLAVVRLLGAPMLAVGIFYGIAGLLVAGYFLRRVWIRNVFGWRRARDGTRSDPSFRLRVVGDGAQTEPLVTDLPDEPFEPLIAFTWFATAFLIEGIGPDGKLADGTTPRKGFPTSVADVTTPQRWLVGILAAIFIFAIFMLQGILLHTRQPFGPVQVMAGLGLASAAVAAITPTYIRIAPGSLDILRFGWRPKGLPAFEHWDLSTCAVLVDHRLGIIRIWDPTPGPRRVLFIRTMQVVCRKQTLIRTLLCAARTRHPTPPLPTDALLG